MTGTAPQRGAGPAATGAGQIAGSIAGVAAAAQVTTDRIRDARAAAADLADMSITLRALVGRFSV